LLNSHATAEQPGVSTRTVCTACTPGLAQPDIAKLSAASAATALTLERPTMKLMD
jgi:hypothetical protein